MTFPKDASLIATSKAETAYNASHIEVLEGLEGVRRRPGMYIGGTDERALHHLVAELLDNAMDEAVAGHADRITLVIATDGGDTGTYSTTWTTADYVLEPFDGVDAGMTGFPYRTVRAVESLTFPTGGYRARVQVTALWGWTAVPDSVTLATKIMAAYLFNLKDSPLGVASFGDAGLIRVRDVPQATMLLDPYAHPARTGPLVA